MAHRARLDPRVRQASFAGLSNTPTSKHHPRNGGDRGRYPSTRMASSHRASFMLRTAPESLSATPAPTRSHSPSGARTQPDGGLRRRRGGSWNDVRLWRGHAAELRASDDHGRRRCRRDGSKSLLRSGRRPRVTHRRNAGCHECRSSSRSSASQPMPSLSTGSKSVSGAGLFAATALAMTLPAASSGRGTSCHQAEPATRDRGRSAHGGPATGTRRVQPSQPITGEQTALPCSGVG